MRGLSGLPDLLDRLDAPDPPERLAAIADELRWSLQTLVHAFDGLAVVRDGRVQLIFKNDPGGARLLIADTATANDRATLLTGLQRHDRALAAASELLGHALGLPAAPARIARLIARVAAHRPGA